MQKGFTLIETIIYIFIFSIIMTGSVISIYAIIGGESRNRTEAMVEEEGSFLIGKIDWALSQSRGGVVTNSGNTITLTDVSGTTFKISISNNIRPID